MVSRYGLLGGQGSRAEGGGGGEGEAGHDLGAGFPSSFFFLWTRAPLTGRQAW